MRQYIGAAGCWYQPNLQMAGFFRSKIYLQRAGKGVGVRPPFELRILETGKDLLKIAK